MPLDYLFIIEGFCFQAFHRETCMPGKATKIRPLRAHVISVATLAFQRNNSRQYSLTVNEFSSVKKVRESGARRFRLLDLYHYSLATRGMCRSKNPQLRKILFTYFRV